MTEACSMSLPQWLKSECWKLYPPCKFTPRGEIDGSSDGVTVHVCGRGLGHDDRLHHVGQQQSHPCTALVVLVGAWYALSVELYGVILRSQSPYHDKLAFALVLGNGYTGDTLQGFGCIAVGEFAELLVIDDIDDVQGIFLECQCSGLSPGKVSIHYNVFQGTGVFFQYYIKGTGILYLELFLKIKIPEK